MKAKLEFYLPEEEVEHEMCLNGPKYYSAIKEFYYGVLRNRKIELSDDPGACMLIEELERELEECLSTRELEIE